MATARYLLDLSADVEDEVEVNRNAGVDGNLDTSDDDL
jgi:hypothetical protein